MIINIYCYISLVLFHYVLNLFLMNSLFICDISFSFLFFSFLFFFLFFLGIFSILQVTKFIDRFYLRINFFVLLFLAFKIFISNVIFSSKHV